MKTVREVAGKRRGREQEASGFHSGGLRLDCIAKHQRAERRLRQWEISFHRSVSFGAQQRGRDFALVQARHSSRVISYFAKTAPSTSLFTKQFGKSKAARPALIGMGKRRQTHVGSSRHLTATAGPQLSAHTRTLPPLKRRLII